MGTAVGAGMTRGRALNRVRILLDRRVTPATVLDWACESHPDSEAIAFDEALPYPLFRSNRLSPREALSFASRTGAVLRESGMRRNDRVAIFKRNEVDYVLLSLAVIRAGGIAVPVNPGMPVEVLGRYLEYTGAKMVCSDARHFAEAIADSKRLPMVERWIYTDADPGDGDAAAVLSSAIAEVDDTSPVSLNRDSQVMLAHTSGTTGTPKSVICTARSLLAGIRAHYRTEPPLPWKRVGIAGPFSHLVYQIGLTTLLLSNMPTKAISSADPDVALDAIERDRLNLFVAFPELYLKMYAAGLDGWDLSSMRVWVSVADSSHEAHMRAFCGQGGLLRVFGRPLVGSLFIEPLGSSEIGGPALRRIWHERSQVRCKRRIGHRMLGGPRVKVVDSRDREVAPGQPGRLVVKGPTVFAGYWNAHDRLHGAMADGWWASGDIVYRDRRRRFHHLDREVDVVQTPAGPFYTLPAEDVLHTYPGVLEAVVFGVGRDNAELPAGLVWLAEDAEVNMDELLQWANSRISGPVGLVFVESVTPESIPRGLTGKVLKRVLRERYGDLAEVQEMQASRR